MVATASTVVSREFVNKCGERWLLRIDPESGDATLFGDEVDWIHGIEIRNDVVDPTFIFALDEVEWLTTSWLELTTRQLVLPAANRAQQAARANS